MNKVVLITGASSGIGKTTAEFLTQKGCKVYGTSRSIRADKFTFNLLQLDVNQTDTIQKAIAIVLQKEGRLDVVINNAGMGITGPIEDTPTEEMRKVFDTNLFGAIDVIKAVLPQMRQQKSGLIINITSIAGYMGLPFRGMYSASKAAFEIVTETLRMEVREFGVHVVNVAPGDFATNIAAGRYHTPVFENSAYKEIYKKNLETMDAHVAEGSDPKEMAEKIYEIIRNPNPKIHYRVGTYLQKFSIVLKRVLPDKMYEKLLMRHYGMR